MRKVLFVGAHVDDIELGCGGTLHKHQDWDCHCLTISKHSFSPLGKDGPNPDIWKSQVAALKHLGDPPLELYSHRTNFLEEERNAVYQTLKNAAEKFAPDWVFVNHPDDHQDHGTVYREAVRAFYDSSLICYPISSSTQNFEANYYEVLPDDSVEAKIASLREYGMYKDKPYFKNAREHLIAAGTYLRQGPTEVFRIVKLIEP